MNIVSKLNISHDNEKLLSNCKKIISTYGWGNLNQISLTHRPEITHSERYFDGIGSLPKGCKESDFSMLNQDLIGTYIEEIINLIPYKLGRIRLMKMKHRSCYSVHQDSTMRIHIPLITNPQALMIWTDHSIIVHMPIGDIYLTDTTLKHTAMNGSMEERIHIVGALI